tara:strand:+ start:221 stop:838 length:618 start_codon:yes stop_codon:yes gene_type:complete
MALRKTNYTRGIFSDTYSIGNMANKRDYILTFTHEATGHSVSFPANLQSFDDQHIAEISELTFADRMDPLIQQASTTRDISFSFEVLSSSLQEGRHNARSVNMLLQFMYPKLAPDGSVEAGSFIGISGLNFFQDSKERNSVSCVIQSIVYNINPDAGFILDENDLAVNFYPVSLVIDIQATAIIPSDRKDDERDSPVPKSYPRYL